MREPDSIRADLARYTERRDRLNKKIEQLEKDLQEAENLKVLGVVKEYGLTPEQLSAFLKKVKDKLPTAEDMKEVKGE